MKYHFDKEGRYIGCNNCGIEPEGSAGCTTMGPEHSGQVFNVEEKVWETPAKRKVKDSAKGPDHKAKCSGITKAGTSCKHKATHGKYCRQHVPA